ncbi:hypothetical protein SAMN05192534_11276 [Alteribacillus persepolensis]|uniref:Uncharacterized protein n=1 Tax=Alteribacillus persepolensis TaxID=568899 RepID=A0A1G8FKB0_9BACI|nr:hypothetical protein [Alteribacillus persepolensis]SDH82603.1 hypothetical protein SAMN05192534_11276 [Alteribacillus persepolensis]
MNQEPIHLYLSRYKEHIKYLRDTGQETPGWRDLREEELPEYLQVKQSKIEINTDTPVRDYEREGTWKKGSMLTMTMELADGTQYTMNGYFVEEKDDWYPNENPAVHKSKGCGFCQSIIGLGGEDSVKEEFCMLPLPEKKYLFEEVLRRHKNELYDG